MQSNVTAGLLSRAESWHVSLRDALPVDADTDAQLQAVLEDARAARLDNPSTPLLTILLLGPTGAGKSELLNALAGARIAQSHYLRPTTTRPTIYAHAGITAGQLSEYSELLGSMATTHGSFVAHQQESLRHKVIIDAPDIDSYKTEHRLLVMKLLPIVDVVIYVVTPFSYKDNIGWETVLKERGRRAFAFVMNKWDNDAKPDVSPREPQADDDFAQLLRARSGYAQPHLFRTSAKYWIERRTDGRAGDPPPGDQLSELEAWLSSGLATSEVAQIHERRREVLWQRMATAIHAATPPSVNWDDWMQQVTSNCDSLRYDGRRTLEPYLVARSQQIAETRKSFRPRSFGLLGAIIAGTSSLGKWKRLPGLIAIPETRASEGATDAKPADLPSVGQQLARLAELRLSSLGWSTRQCGIAPEKVQRSWAERLNDLGPEFDLEFWKCAAAAESRRIGKLRHGFAIAVMVLLELAAVALIATAVWRVAEGYLKAQYVTIGFAVSFVVLFLVMVALAYGVRVLLFPTSPERVLEELRRPLHKRWDDTVFGFKRSAVEYHEKYEKLREEGLQFHLQCANAALESKAAWEKVTGDNAGEVQRLFAS